MNSSPSNVLKNKSSVRDVKLLLVVNIFIELILIILYAFTPNVYHKIVQNVVLSISFIVVILFFFSNFSDTCFRTKYIRVTYLFLIGFIVVFFQKNIDLAVGLIDEFNAVFCNTTIINKCCILSSIGLVAFAIGNFWARLSTKYSKYGNSKIGHPIGKPFFNFLKSMFAIFVIIYLSANMMDVLSGNYYYSEATMKENAGSIANYSNVMIYVLVFTILISYLYNSSFVENRDVSLWMFLKTNGLFYNLLLVLYLVVQFVMGDRGPIITIILAYFIVFIRISKKRVKIWYLVIFFLLSAAILSTIGNLRHETNRISVDKILSYEKDDNITSVLHVTEELSHSYNTFTYVVANVPSHHDYFLGKMQMREIIMSVPFLHRFVPSLFSDYEYENSSSDYCSYLIQGRNRTYGNGSSILADIYLDFGIIGIIIIMFLLGLLMYRLDLEIYYGNNIYAQLTSLVFFSFSIYLSRSTLTTPLYYMIPSLCLIYLKKYFK